MSFLFYSKIDPKLLEERRKKIKSLKARMDIERSWSDRIADKINSGFGSMNFFLSHGVFFTVWIVLNTHVVPNFPAFDPYPFGFLTMVVSLEAIFLSIFVLISQNRASKVDDVREEVDLQVNVKAEQEITQILSMLDEINAKLGIVGKNKRKINGMKKNTDLKKIEADILQEIEEDL